MQNLEKAKTGERTPIPVTQDVPTRQDWLNRGVEPPETAPRDEERKRIADARDYGDWCIYCGKDAETCEHYEEANKE
jgi:hypothetical protein